MTFKQLKKHIQENRVDADQYYKLESLINSAFESRKISHNQWNYLIEFLNCNF
jgi:hypothetical protein